MATSSPKSTSPQSIVRLRVSNAIADDYMKREVFYEVESSSACTVKVSRAVALRMLSDAEYNGDSSNGPDEMPSGMRRAYRAFAEQIRREVGVQTTNCPAPSPAEASAEPPATDKPVTGAATGAGVSTMVHASGRVEIVAIDEPSLSFGFDSRRGPATAWNDTASPRANSAAMDAFMSARADAQFIRRSIASGEVEVSPEFAALAITLGDAELIAAVKSYPVSPEPTPGTPSPTGSDSSAVSPSSLPTGHVATDVAGAVSKLELRVEGHAVTGLLTCHCCAGDGRVENGHRMDVTCGACKGTGARRLESTHADWIACWSESVLFFTEAEHEEADATLTALEESAAAEYFRLLNGRPFYCSGTREHPHKPLGIEREGIRCAICGGKAHAVLTNEVAA